VTYVTKYKADSCKHTVQTPACHSSPSQTDASSLSYDNPTKDTVQPSQCHNYQAGDV